jgi:aryl-alcohol dehydrogenase-like predicted oxidoreductase
MGFDYIDLIYANPPPEELPVASMVEAVGGLLSAGKARAWAIVNWQPGPFLAAALKASGAGVVASFVMAGGVLTGKYDAGGSGRAAGELDQPQYAVARDCGLRLGALAAELGVSAAALAIGFALRNRDVASVLFGATSAEQIADNAAALELGPEVLARVDALCA